MNDSSKHKIFNTTDCISEQMMFDYIDNKLSAKERHTVEKHLLDCGLCSDALEGLEMVKDRNRIEVIHQKVNERIAETVNEKKIIPINYKTFMAVAAGLLLLVGSVFLFKEFSSSTMEDKTVAELKEPPPPPSPITIDKTSSTDSVNFATPITKNKEVQSEIKKNARPLALKQEPKINANDNSIASNGASAYTSDEGTGNTIASAGKKNETNQTSAAKEKNVPPEDLKKADEEASDKAAPVAATAAPQKSAEYNEEKRAHSESDRKAKEEKYNFSKSIAGSRASANTDSIYTTVDEMPEYQGGETELFKYVLKNIQFAPTDDKGNIYETLLIQFIIDPTGKAIHPKLLNPQSKEMEKQVIEMVNKMPLWKPGKQKGKTVSVRYNLPVKSKIK